MPRRLARPRLSLLVLVAGTALLGAPGTARADAVDRIRRDGALVVLTRNGPTMYYEGRDGPEGYEHDLALSLARTLNVPARFVVLEDIPAVLAAIEAGEGHVAAAALTRTPERERRYRFGPDYKTVQQQVVCHRQGPVPDRPADLAKVGLEVIAGSSYEERLLELRREIPGLRWRARAGMSTDEVLERVWRREVDCAVADSNIVAINRRYMPELAVAFPITEEEPLAWVLPPDAGRLVGVLEDWFRAARAGGVLDRLEERYYGHVTLFDYVDMKTYQRRIERRLPRLRRHFEAAARDAGLPWTLIAAQSYQESHWDPRARSPAGARGLMMLTRRAAREVGVRNLEDPGANARGGARYLRRMIGRLPRTVREPDRLWMGLAAYNVGFGHVADARTLAGELGREPDRWHELREVLPLLSRRQHYRRLRYGYARGTEPVRYVQRVRDYRDVLEWRLGLRRERPAAAR